MNNYEAERAKGKGWTTIGLTIAAILLALIATSAGW